MHNSMHVEQHACTNTQVEYQSCLGPKRLKTRTAKDRSAEGQKPSSTGTWTIGAAGHRTEQLSHAADALKW